MKLSRRCFLSFVIGGAAGTTLSPLPWKLTDDLSIWSQNWPWTPVPPDGAATYVDSTCTLCPGNCGIRVRKVGDRAVKIEGQEGTLLNNGGGLCLLGMSGLQLLYGPTRVQGPLRRVGKRGEGQWESISWSEAINEVVAKLDNLRTQGKPQAVAALVPKEVGTVPQLFKRLLTAYGSPNFIRMPSVDDSYESALALTQGVTGSVGLDVANTDFILSFGSGLLDGYGSPLNMIQAVSRLKEQHGTLVQVEPRLSNTAAKANVWLPAKAGTEADLALAMAYVIIAKGHYDAEFVEAKVEGFDAFAAMVNEKYQPETVAKRCGLTVKTIEDTALAFAGAKHPLAVLGRGKGQVAVSLKEALAVNALNTLTGSINRQGGAQTLPLNTYLNWPEVPFDDTAAIGLKTARMDGAGTAAAPHVRYLPHRLIDKVNSAPGELQVLFVSEANPVSSLPNTAIVKEAFSKVPFVVSFSSFMDETATQADLILPNHIYLERFEDVPAVTNDAESAVGLCRPVVAPVNNTRHVGDVVIQIAKALKGTVAEAFPWSDYKSCLRETLADQWKDLNKQGALAMAYAAPASFNTPSGKLILMNGTLGPIYMAATPTPEGKMQLVPYDSIRLASRSIGTPPFMMKIVPDNVLKGQDGFVQINPETGAQLGLCDKGTALLTSPIGQATVRAHFDHRVMPGIICMPRGLGHTAYDGFLAGKGVNINQIIGPVEDPASGLDTAWGIQAELTKA